MERVEVVPDEFEHMENDQHNRELDMIVEEALSLQVADEAALEAVGKVAHVAQSSLRRLQQVVKEKDDLIAILQDAVGSAYKNALDQHKNDQHDMELLQQLLLAQEDHSNHAITNILQNVIKQQPSSENSLANQVAKLFDQYLHEISIMHEQEIDDLKQNLTTLHNRCQELEDFLDRERINSKAYLNAQLSEKVAIYMDTKSQLERMEKLVENLKRQLSKVCPWTQEEKDEQHCMYQININELENLLEEEKVKENNLLVEHERICMDARRSLDQVSNVGLQLQKLKKETQKFQQQKHLYEHQLKDLQDKVTSQNTLIHKLAVQLATLREKRRTTKISPLENKRTKTSYETQRQMQYFQDCIQRLSMQTLLRENKLQEAKEESDDHITGCTQDVTLMDETKIILPFGVAHKSFDLLHHTTMRKLENHARLTKRIELLQRSIKTIKQEMKKRDNDMSVSEATIKQLQYDLRKSHETIQQLQERKQKKMNNWERSPTDCVRLKGLLENIEMLEMENTILKHDVMVQKNRQIAKLERDLKQAQGFDFTMDSKQHECLIATKSLDKNMTMSTKKELEDIIANKESMILELKFEADQATWKMSQVEKRFNILFGALECKKFELDAPIVDSLLDKIFSFDIQKLSAPALISLREKVLHQRGFSHNGSREGKLQDLANALIKVVEKLNGENEALKKSCEDTMKHMEKNKKLRLAMNQLQNQSEIIIRKKEASQERGSSQVISDLKIKLQNLTEANAGLIKALRELENMYGRLKQMVHEKQSQERNRTFQISNRTRRRCSSFEEGEDVTDQHWRLQYQVETIKNLEKQLDIQHQEVAQLNNELEKKDDELDMLHGKIWLQETIENPIENMYQSKVDMWSAEESNNRYCDVKLCSIEDYIDTQFIEENEWKSLKEDNRRLKATATTKF